MTPFCHCSCLHFLFCFFWTWCYGTDQGFTYFNNNDNDTSGDDDNIDNDLVFSMSLCVLSLLVLSFSYKNKIISKVYLCFEIHFINHKISTHVKLVLLPVLFGELPVWYFHLHHHHKGQPTSTNWLKLANITS